MRSIGAASASTSCGRRNLSLPISTGQWSLACAQGALALRTGERSGFGWSAGDDPDFRVESILAILDAGGVKTAPPAKLKAYLEDTSWQGPVQRAAQRAGLVVEMARLPVVRAAPMDLLIGRASGMTAAIAQFDWRIWRVTGCARGRLPRGAS